jgi:Flp pilus assembly pilin Flp
VNDAISNFGHSTTPVESGFIAAGVAISMIAGMQTLVILLSWIVSIF